MSSEKRPWYKWYPKDFVADEKVQLLSPLAELAYRRLLDIMWQANATRLPAVCYSLATAICKGLTKDEAENAVKELLNPDHPLFQITEDGKYIYSKRMSDQRKAIENKAQKRRDAGRKGGLAKATRLLQQNRSKCQSVATAKAKQMPTDTDTDTDIDNTNVLSAQALSKGKSVGKNNRSIECKLSGSEYLESIIQVCRELENKNGKFNPFAFVQKCVNQSKHPQAILETVKSLQNPKIEISNPWAWCDTVIKTKSQMYNERDHAKQSQAFKDMFIQDERIKKLLAGVGS